MYQTDIRRQVSNLLSVRCARMVERISEHYRPNKNTEMEFSGICQAEWGLQSAVFGSLDKENCNGVSTRSLRL